MNDETKLQIEQFLDELTVILTDKTPEEVGDFKFLYAKYPLVRIGIHRACVAIKHRPLLDAVDVAIDHPEWITEEIDKEILASLREKR